MNILRSIAYYEYCIKSPVDKREYICNDKLFNASNIHTNKIIFMTFNRCFL